MKANELTIGKRIYFVSGPNIPGVLGHALIGDFTNAHICSGEISEIVKAYNIDGEVYKVNLDFKNSVNKHYPYKEQFSDVIFSTPEGAWDDFVSRVRKYRDNLQSKVYEAESAAKLLEEKKADALNELVFNETDPYLQTR